MRITHWIASVSLAVIAVVCACAFTWYAQKEYARHLERQKMKHLLQEKMEIDRARKDPVLKRLRDEEAAQKRNRLIEAYKD